MIEKIENNPIPKAAVFPTCGLFFCLIDRSQGVMNKGALAAFIAFLMWGFLPLYIKRLEHSTALEILSHRTLWSLLFVFLLLLFRSQWRPLMTRCRQNGVLQNALGCAVLLGANWLIYTWAVTSDHMVEASLGYFINPLISVLLGMVFLQERLRPLQWLSITIAAAGVVYLGVNHGRPPWIALILATTFGVYGFLRKRSQLNSLDGLAVETGMLSLPALLYLIYLSHQSTGSFTDYGISYALLLMGSGIATALPLLLFAHGARQITLTTLGLMQYIAPSIQLMLGVFIYNEPFSEERMVGFAFIWLALLLFTGENLYRRYRYRTSLNQGYTAADREFRHAASGLQTGHHAANQKG
jgi:chloramphenicol-sensitive protein RarD